VRRLARILLNALTVLSTVLFGATVALWVRGWLAAERLIEGAAPLSTASRFGQPRWHPPLEPLWISTRHWGARIWSLGAGNGEFVVMTRPSAVDERPGPPPVITLDTPLPGLTINKTKFNGQNFTEVFIPYWYPLGTFALLPTARLVRWVRIRRRSSYGLCPSCGYDLRATPERCPECGSIPAKA
jgi:hypothetical protein